MVYSGKFKLFDPRYARVKKFEFALVNHSFEPIRSEIKFPTYFVPLIWLHHTWNCCAGESLQIIYISLEMVEDFKHVRYEDDSSIRNAEVNSSMGVSGTASSPGDGAE